MARTVLMSPERVRRTLTRLAYEVIERNRGTDGLVVFGIRTRGTALAGRLADALTEAGGQPVDLHALDISSFRDDRPEAEVSPPDASIDTEGRDVLLVDDVAFTGRTARAALDAVLQYGRPRSIRLAVLVDRGHREVPVHPDFVGRVVPTKHGERVVVDVDEPAVYVED